MGTRQKQLRFIGERTTGVRGRASAAAAAATAARVGGGGDGSKGRRRRRQKEKQAIIEGYGPITFRGVLARVISSAEIGFRIQSTPVGKVPRRASGGRRRRRRRWCRVGRAGAAAAADAADAAAAADEQKKRANPK